MRVYRCGPFELNADALILTCEGEPLALGPRVVETLLALVERSGEVMTKGELLDRVWPQGFVTESNLAQNIYVLRKAFKERGFVDVIETMPGRGYRFTQPAQALVLKPSARARPRVAIAGALFAACISVALVALANRHVPANPSPAGAMRFYQVGRYYWNMRSRDAVRASVAYFSRAIDANPTDPRGYAGLADANVTIGDYCFGTHQPSVYFARARQYVTQALALDQNSPEATASLGFIALHQRHTSEALSALRRAIALSPSYAPAHEWYGIALLQRARWREGKAELQTALRLDPLSVATIAWLSSAAYGERRYADAIRYARMALELSPQRTDALTVMGEAYAAQGNLDRARQIFEHYASIAPYYRAQGEALLARAEARAHRMREARNAFSYALSHANAVKDVDLAAAARAVGENRIARDVLAGRAGHESSDAVEDAAGFIAG